MVPVALRMENGRMWGTLATLVFAALKEAWWDEHFEDPETRGSGLQDFAHYLLGLGLAFIVLAIF